MTIKIYYENGNSIIEKNVVKDTISLDDLGILWYTISNCMGRYIGKAGSIGCKIIKWEVL